MVLITEDLSTIGQLLQEFVNKDDPSLDVTTNQCITRRISHYTLATFIMPMISKPMEQNTTHLLQRKANVEKRAAVENDKYTAFDITTLKV